MLTEINNNIYTDSSGKNKYLFEVEMQDLEQKDYSQIVNFINGLKSYVGKFKHSSIFKIYHLNDKMIFETDKDHFPINQLRYSHYTKGISLFTSQENICSDEVYTNDFVKLNGQYFRFIYISLKEDHMIDVAGFQKFGDYFMTFERMHTVFSKSLISDARKMNHSSLYKSLSDIEGIENYKNNEDMLRKIITREEELFKTEVHFVVRAKTEEELSHKTDVLLSRLEDDGLCPKIETRALNQVFKNFFPGSFAEIQKPLYFHSSLLVNSMPLHKDKITNTGIKFHSKAGQSIGIDTRDGNNYSVIVTGRSGEGKTFLVNKLIENEINNGNQILIFDVKGDYRKQSMLKNAKIIDEKINPMIFKCPIFLRDLIISNIPSEERSKLFNGKLLRAIRDTEAYTQNNFWKSLDLLKSKGFKDLEFYFEDIRDKISSDKTELNDFTYIEYSSFSEQMMPFLLTFCFEYIKRFDGPYSLVVDEAHRVYKHDPDFLDDRVREMRSSLGSLITITQSLMALVETTFGRVVDDQSFHKFIFAQEVQENSSLDSFDVSKIRTLKTEKDHYSEFYYKTEYIRKIARYYPSRKEYELFNSEKKKTEKLFSFIEANKKFYSVDECINQWVRGVYA